jgi:hypothetical protein
MTDQPNPDSPLDKWLSDQYEALKRDVTAKLDLEAGFQEAILRGRYELLADDVRRSLDLEAGLTAVLSASMEPAEHPAAFASGSSDKASVQIDGSNAVDRLAFRTHTETPPPEACECLKARTAIFGFLKLAADTLQRLVQEEDVTADDIIVAIEKINSAVTRSMNDSHRSFSADLGNLRDLARSLTNIRDLYSAYPTTSRASRKLAERLDELDRFSNDFTKADLRRAKLDGLRLAGVRWSEQTKWPGDWEDRIRENSAPLASESGVFVILRELPQAS